MALQPGTRLGAYEIVALIGAGGMGEVYRAKDMRLDRTVAIKVLPARIAADPEAATASNARGAPSRRSSTRTSARSMTSASMTAPTFLVMQYLEGETLEARLTEGRAAAGPSRCGSPSRSPTRSTEPIAPASSIAI